MSIEYPKNWNEIKEKIKLRDGHRCLRCGSSELLHIHHIKPISMGGTNDPTNLVTICEKCHFEKHPYLQANLCIRLIYSLNNRLQNFLWKLNLMSNPTLTYAIRYFGFKKLLPNQKEPIEHVLNGKDTLIVMATGSGKSLCYWLPSILFKDGFTLVVSPLIALMQDQVIRLTKLGIPATFINSTISKEERLNRIKLVKEGMFRLVYIAPERFNKEFIDAIQGLKINIFVVDEAHCVNIWGDAFRPDYMRLRNIRREIGNPPIAALTATANKMGQEEICKRLGLANPKIFVSGFDRPNISLNTFALNNKEEKLNKLLEILSYIISPGIIYTATIREAKEIYEFLSQRLQLKKIALYHGDMNPRERESVQSEFLDGNIDILISTKAFGMGIDKKNIRFIIHFTLPESLVDYYQEIGRAGRDNNPSLTVLLFNKNDIETRKFLISCTFPNEDKLRQVCSSIFKIPEDQSYLIGKNDEVETIIKILTKEGCIRYEYVNENGRINFKVTSLEKLNGQQLDSIIENLEKSKQKKDIELLEISEYIQLNSCKRRYILSYFGEKKKEVNFFLSLSSFLAKMFFGKYKISCCNICNRGLAISNTLLVNKPIILPNLFFQDNMRKIKIWYNEIRQKGGFMENDKKLDYIFRIIRIPIIVSIVMLLFAMYPIKIYGYFVFLRLVVFTVAMVSVFVNKKINKFNIMWFSVFIALLFNPFIPIYLTKTIWVYIDIVTIIFLLKLWFVVKSSIVVSKEASTFPQTHTTERPRELLCHHCRNIIDLSDIFCSKCGRRVKIAPFQPQVELKRNPELLVRLKQWRSVKAREFKMPAYIIFHDTTLIEICNLLPRNKDELSKIKGMGTNKINKFGDEIISLINAYLQTRGNSAPLK